MESAKQTSINHFQNYCFIDFSLVQGAIGHVWGEVVARKGGHNGSAKKGKCIMIPRMSLFLLQTSSCKKTIYLLNEL